MAEIRLYGKLRKQFASLYNLEIRSVGEAVRALCTMVPGFKQSLSEGNYVVKVGPMGKRLDVGAEEVHFMWGDATIHIVPIPQGSKRGGIGKIIAGLALIALSFIPGLNTGVFVLKAATENMAAITVASIAQSLGVMMLMGGISRALAPRPKNNKTEKDESYVLNGPVSTVDNQTTVPVVYGLKVRCGMVVVSAGSTVEDMLSAPTNNWWFNAGQPLPPNIFFGGRYGTVNSSV